MPAMNSDQLTFVVLAGGMSSRFGGDKQIEEIDGVGRTIMELSILEAARAGVTRVVLIVNTKVRPIIEEHILPRMPDGVEVILADQTLDQVPAGFEHRVNGREKPWGTGHALLAAKDHFSGKGIVVNADDYYGKHAYQQLADALRSSDDWAMVGYPIDGTLSDKGSVNRGICTVDDETLTNVVETYGIERDGDTIRGKDGDGNEREVASGTLASMAIWGFDDKLMARLERNFSTFLAGDPGPKDEFLLTDEIQDAIAEDQQRIRVVTAVDEWLGVTFKPDLADVTSKLQKVYAGDDLSVN